MTLAGLREGYPREFREYPMDIHHSSNLAPFFFLFSMDIPTVFSEEKIPQNFGEYVVTAPQ